MNTDYLNSYSRLSLESDSINLAQSTHLVANGLYADKQQLIGEACKASELGKITKQSMGLGVSLSKSKLTCTYSPLLCQARTGKNYCYISSQANELNLLNDSDNVTNAGYMGYKYFCPDNTPIALNYSANIQTLNINYSNCIGSIQHPVCNLHSQLWQKSFSAGELGAQFLTGSNLGYTVKLGAQIFPYKTNSCSDNCAALLSIDRSAMGHADVSSGSCICSSDKLNAIYKVLNSYSTALGALRAMACTSRVTVDAN